MAINKEKKDEMLAGYNELLGKSQAVIITQYGGLKMLELDKVRGQIRGGIAMGIGVTLMEQIRHDGDGHALSGSFEDYLLPLAGDVPNVEVLHHETPSPFTGYGVKGGAEGGRMVAPGAITPGRSRPSSPGFWLAR